MPSDVRPKPELSDHALFEGNCPDAHRLLLSLGGKTRIVSSECVRHKSTDCDEQQRSVAGGTSHLVCWKQSNLAFLRPAFDA